LSSFLYASAELSLGNETKVYDKIFEKIGETRVGANVEDINRLRNPFVVIYRKRKDANGTKRPQITYTLDGIFENKAKINGKWRKKYSKIGTYKLIKIKKRSVVLRNTNENKELFIRNNNDSKIKFSSK